MQPRLNTVVEAARLMAMTQTEHDRSCPVHGLCSVQSGQKQKSARQRQWKTGGIEPPKFSFFGQNCAHCEVPTKLKPARS